MVGCRGDRTRQAGRRPSPPYVALGADHLIDTGIGDLEGGRLGQHSNGCFGPHPDNVGIIERRKPSRSDRSTIAFIDDHARIEIEQRAVNRPGIRCEGQSRPVGGRQEANESFGGAVVDAVDHDAGFELTAAGPEATASTTQTIRNGKKALLCLLEDVAGRVHDNRPSRVGVDVGHPASGPAFELSIKDLHEPLRPAAEMQNARRGTLRLGSHRNERSAYRLGDTQGGVAARPAVRSTELVAYDKDEAGPDAPTPELTEDPLHRIRAMRFV